jgi:hypothetical protein
MAGRIPGAQLPLFLLQRGALAAGVAASSALDQALAQGAAFVALPRRCHRTGITSCRVSQHLLLRPLSFPAESVLSAA